MPAGLLGIDLGTSSMKAVVTDLDGAVVAQATRPYDVVSRRPGWAETDPAAWWEAVRAASAEAVAAGGRDIRGIGLSGQMHGVVLTAEDGSPTRAGMLHPDTRAAGALDVYRRLPPQVLDRLANPLSPNMAGPLLLWAAEQEPAAYEAARWMLQPKDWVRLRLTGLVHAEPSDASATLLYDVRADQWDLDLVERLGLRTGLLAPLMEASGAVAGSLLPDAAAKIGVAAGTPVAAGGGDTAVAALGGGLTHPGDVQLTIGSSGQVIALRDTPLASPETGTHLYRAVTPRGWYAMAAILNAGIALDWVRRMLGAGWPEVYAAAALPASADAPLFLPHLTGDRTPYLDSTMRGAWIGLGLGHDRAALLRAALEGVAFSLRDGFEALPGADSAHELRLAGGGSTSQPWRQLLADILRRPLRAIDVSAASGRGAALLGGIAANELTWDDVQRLAPGSQIVATPTEPGGASDDVHEQRFATWHERLQRLRGSRTTTPIAALPHPAPARA
jgi:xylulokinase